MSLAALQSDVLQACCCKSDRDATVAALTCAEFCEGAGSLAWLSATSTPGKFTGTQRHAMKQLRKQTKRAVIAQIKRDPEAYGFTGLEMLILGWIISGILSAVFKILFDRLWNRNPTLLAAIGGAE